MVLSNQSKLNDLKYKFNVPRYLLSSCTNFYQGSEICLDLSRVIMGAEKEYAKHCSGDRVRQSVSPEILLMMRLMHVGDCNPKDFDAVRGCGQPVVSASLGLGEISVPSEAAYGKGNYSETTTENFSNLISPKISKRGPISGGSSDIYTDKKMCPATTMLMYFLTRVGAALTAAGLRTMH